MMTDPAKKRFVRHPERGNSILRAIDRYAGIPIVLLLGMLRQRSSVGISGSPRKAAFLQTAAIGDTVLSSAIVQDWKRCHPRSHLTLFTGASNFEIATLIPGVDTIIRLPVTRPFGAMRLIRNAGHFDVWLDFGAWPRINALYSWAADADLKIGFETAGQHRHAVYDRAAHHSQRDHEIANYRRLLEVLGVPCGKSLPVLTHHGAARVNGRITVHPFPGGSRSYLKEWPEDHWIKLLTVLSARNYDIYLTGAGVDRDRALALKAKVGNAGGISVVAGMQTIPEVVELLHSSQVVISVDTGIMHIASALGANLIALHGPTDPDRWGPLNANAVALRSGDACSPCISLGFDSSCTDARCMGNIPVDRVLHALEHLLSGEGASGDRMPGPNGHLHASARPPRS